MIDLSTYVNLICTTQQKKTSFPCTVITSVASLIEILCSLNLLRIEQKTTGDAFTDLERNVFSACELNKTNKNNRKQFV